MASVAAVYHLPPRVLPSIQAVEGGRPGLVHLNTDGSHDLGVMQVNTRWVQPLAWQTGLAPAVAEQRLLFDGCFNIAVAGAIMRIYLNEAHGNLLLAVGYYNSHTPPLAQAYQLRVLHAAVRLFGAASPR
jgi:soluble lytic murein transglycosylase-like protein